QLVVLFLVLLLLFLLDGVFLVLLLVRGPCRRAAHQQRRQRQADHQPHQAPHRSFLSCRDTRNQNRQSNRPSFCKRGASHRRRVTPSLCRKQHSSPPAPAAP